MTNDFIPFHRPTVKPEHAEAVNKVLLSGWLATGKVCAQFEEEFAQYVGSRYAVAVNSCTAALHLALLGSGISPEKKDLAEVITSPITFVSAVNVIAHVGARPVFCDIRSDDLTLDPAQLESLITLRTRAIIATHLAGYPCQMDQIEAIAAKHGISVITDAAHGIETTFHGKHSGQLGRAACYSFYATKNMTTGEGGMLATSEEWLASYARRMRLHGMDQDAWKRYGPAGYKHWDVEEPGWKYNMPDTAAALGLCQLRELDGWMSHRIKIASMYEQAFENDDRVQLMDSPDRSSTPALHLFVIRIKKRDQAMQMIQERGVGVGVHFRAVHRLKYMQGHVLDMPLPQAEAASDEVLSLPLYPTLTVDQAARVIETVRGVLQELAD